MRDESCQKILFIARMQKLRWYIYLMILLDKLKMKAGILCSYCASLFQFAKGFITIIS